MRNPAPTVPAPTASDFPKKERRLMERLYGLLFSSSFCVCGWSWLLPKSFAVDALVVFILVELEAPASHATAEKLRVCYFVGPPKASFQLSPQNFYGDSRIV